MEPLRRIGLIGDVHCEDRSLELAIDTLRSQAISTILCTGDLPTGQGDINVCSDLLRKNNVLTIRGNHDRWLLDRYNIMLPFATLPEVVSKVTWRFLESLPATIELPTLVGLAQLCHGLDVHDMHSISPDQSDTNLIDDPILSDLENSARYRVIINGHSHRRMVRAFGSMIIINGGTLRSDHEPCFAEIDFELELVSFWLILNGRFAKRSTTLGFR